MHVWNCQEGETHFWKHFLVCVAFLWYKNESYKKKNVDLDSKTGEKKFCQENLNTFMLFSNCEETWKKRIFVCVCVSSWEAEKISLNSGKENPEDLFGRLIFLCLWYKKRCQIRVWWKCLLTSCVVRRRRRRSYVTPGLAKGSQSAMRRSLSLRGVRISSVWPTRTCWLSRSTCWKLHRWVQPGTWRPKSEKEKKTNSYLCCQICLHWAKTKMENSSSEMCRWKQTWPETLKRLYLIKLFWQWKTLRWKVKQTLKMILTLSNSNYFSVFYFFQCQYDLFQFSLCFQGSINNDRGG